MLKASSSSSSSSSSAGDEEAFFSLSLVGLLGGAGRRAASLSVVRSFRCHRRMAGKLDDDQIAQTKRAVGRWEQWDVLRQRNRFIRGIQYYCSVLIRLSRTHPRTRAPLSQGYRYRKILPGKIQEPSQVPELLSSIQALDRLLCDCCDNCRKALTPQADVGVRRQLPRRHQLIN